jgi:hypothetical protein
MQASFKLSNGNTYVKNYFSISAWWETPEGIVIRSTDVNYGVDRHNDHSAQKSPLRPADLYH